MPEGERGMEQISAPQEGEQTGREVIERVSADIKDPSESPPDSRQVTQGRIEEINQQLDKFDGQLFEFTAKLEDPNFDQDARPVVEKVMRLIAEQQAALVTERAERELIASNEAVALDMNKTQLIPQLRRETKKITFPTFPDSPPGAPHEELPRLPDDALTELPPELPNDALTPIDESPIEPSPAPKEDQSFNLYQALEGVPRENLSPPSKKINPYGSPEGHILDSRIEGDARQAKVAEEIARNKESIASIVEARRKKNDEERQQPQAA